MSEPVRRVQIVGPGARGEGARVLQAAVLVAVASLLVIGRGGRSGDAQASLAPYQVAFGDLAPAEQRIARSMGEGLLEAEATRARTHAWPTLDALAAEGIPPFAPDPLAPKQHWTLLREGALLNYVGQSGESGPAYLITIQEPEPGVPGDPPGTPPDETHHVLADGTILHVGLWVRDPPVELQRPTARPFAEGWKQIVTARPKEPS